MVETKRGQLVDSYPTGIELFHSLAVEVVEIYQGVICHRNHTLTGIAVYSAECAYLLHIHIVKACQIMEHPLGGSFHTFVGFHKTAHKRPLPLFRLETALGQQ